MAETRKIAVDFDGTLVENAYPGIGKPIIFAFDTLKRLQDKGFRLILWTYRHGKSLDEAVAFCEKQGVTFYAINQSYPEETSAEGVSRKINADIFIDDRNIGGLMDWGLIYQELIGENTDHLKKQKSKSVFSFLKR